MSAHSPGLQLNLAALPLEVVEWAGETWDVVRRLGSGKFAVVAEIRSRTPPHARLAAKMIDHALISPWAEHQLKAEVEVWMTLEHPHICKLHGSVTVGRHLVLLLDLAAGGELFERIMAWDDFKEETAARLMRQLLGAVAYLHERGVIHRDLKPENLLLDSDDEGASLRIADFGACKRIASRAEPARVGGTPYAAFATTPCGSLGYAAPEQLRQQMYECQVDVWSAGVVAYVLLSGCMPFDPSTYAGSSFELCLPASLFGGTSARALDFLRQLLQVEPTQRPTAQQALAHPWLRLGEASPQPTSLPTSRRLQALAESGSLRGRFTHARDLWLFQCATTPVGTGSADPAQQPAPFDPYEESEQDVPILSLPPAHVRKRAKTEPAEQERMPAPAAAEPLPAAIAPKPLSQPPPGLPLSGGLTMTLSLAAGGAAAIRPPSMLSMLAPSST